MTVPPQPPPMPPPSLPPGWPDPWAGRPGAGGPVGPEPVAGPPPLPPPPPVVVTRRIPTDQPYVVRPNASKRAVVFSALLLFILLMMACPTGLAALSAADAVGLLIFLAGFAVFIGLLLGLQLLLLVSGGPVLAAGPAGVWIKTRPTRGQAIWLPWESVERIYPRRWGLEKMVCVKPRDPRTGANLGAFTALDSSMQQLFFGTGFTATLNFADRPESEIMQALRHFSAGHCPVG
ncbi:hypothetical protein V6U90_03900 [Micromonospora sp. CPCC 206060]|uniref:hypothetical protein n=1 Tax=Micromonospora sp. CPCC 206060 TaxID=3122406 RepID=UPI002FEECED1